MNSSRHTMTLRYPEHPTHDEREALKNYFYLTSRLYPCGECASHFQKLLKEYPPQTATRKTASLWLCHIHNLVNIRLKKPEFDCGKLDTTYDCGCGPNNTTSSHLSSTSNSNSAPTTIPKLDTKDVKVEDESSPRGEPVKKDEITGVDMIRGGVRKREQDGQ
ncbi:ERV/ALR sulfhydryl oxidase domain-containing protein [Cantharellus anzutake]|uniref:ERV/ALR sulfhydryl oxidase domain-containing protein n=1 Tax=Cantharellus anzutake TaxID=1750568 RepID=UPI00190663AB|nr:ERV/ALR sulfhydryl oxidase domain-containing protein [Cantharellus anzutake]KAF8334226.1 ERV/ALR sulfhydryl oxidase domain-containing protein [Cantharellus anzutake]